MPTQTYCTQLDIEAIWTPAALLASVDDNEDGVLSPAEAALIERAIQRAANSMNALLEVRYALVDIAGNLWCRDCNAVLAAYLLATRRDEPPPAGLASERQRYLTDLREMRDGQQQVPQVAESNHHAPTVSNFAIDLRAQRAKVRRIIETSSGDPPHDQLLSFPLAD